MLNIPQTHLGPINQYTLPPMPPKPMFEIFTSSTPVAYFNKQLNLYSNQYQGNAECIKKISPIFEKYINQTAGIVDHSCYKSESIPNTYACFRDENGKKNLSFLQLFPKKNQIGFTLFRSDNSLDESFLSLNTGSKAFDMLYKDIYLSSKLEKNGEFFKGSQLSDYIDLLNEKNI